MATPILWLLFQDQYTLIQKDEFVIGRSPEADLRIDHSFVSRKHALIQLFADGYYIIDHGTSCGIERNGMRVARQKIQEGDVYHILDFAFKFTYQEP